MPAQPSDGLSRAASSAKAWALGVIAAAAGLDIEAVKSERLGVVAARHRTEERVGRVGVAAKLRRLRTQQERERFGGRDARDFSRMQARRGQIAGADRDQAARYRLVGALAAPAVQLPAQDERRAQGDAQQAPQQRQ